MRDGVPPGRRSIDKYCITGEVKSGAVKGFTPLCPTWAALVGDGLVAMSLWIPPEV